MWNKGKIHHLVRDPNTGQNKVSVFLRQLKRGDRYYARFKIDDRSLANNKPYITESLRTKDLDTALERARNRYAEIKFRQQTRSEIKPLSVNEGIDRFVNHYSKSLKVGIHGFSEHMLRNYKKTIDTHWREYLGSRSLDSLNVADLEDYEAWRRQRAMHLAQNAKKHGNYKKNLAARTIQWEINSFKAMLRWCAGRNLYNGRVYEWSYKLKEKNRRSAFTLEQYEKLYRYMRTNMFLRKGKHGNDSRIRRHRAMLRAYILFMANTGLRVGEARYLRWKDIRDDKNKLGERVVVVSVSAAHSKVRKSRQAVGRVTAMRALERWKEYLEASGESATNDRYIFCDSDDNAIKSFREGFNSVIKEAGVETDRDGNKLTIYSLRHTYITLRLRIGKLRIHSLAKNCGTSVSMIEEYYSDAIPTDFIDELTT